MQKALNIFNAALVTPTYYVFFTSSTIVTSAILFQGFKGPGTAIATVVMGFLQICSGVILLQLSKSAKDVPDAAVFKGDLDQVREVATQEEPESEPKADAIRGTAAIVRRMSTARRKTEDNEARRYFKEKQEDTAPPADNEVVEWDGLRRRKTVVEHGQGSSRPHTPGSVKSPLPPLGMSHFPTEDEDEERPGTTQTGQQFLDGIRSRASTMLHPTHWRLVHGSDSNEIPPVPPVPLDEITGKGVDTSYHGVEIPPPGRERSDTPRSIAWADDVPSRPATRRNSLIPEPQHAAKRQFSFNTVFNRMRPRGESTPKPPPTPRSILRRAASGEPRASTEEERMGLVHGDSQHFGQEDGDNESLERISSMSSASSEANNQRHIGPLMPPSQPLRRESSASTMSTTAFPPYEDTHHGHSGHYYTYTPPRQVSSPDHDDTEDGWQRQTSRPLTHAHHSSGSIPSRSGQRSPPSVVGHVSSGGEPFMRVTLRSPGHSPDSSDLGVTSLSSSPARAGQESDSRATGDEAGQRARSGQSGADDAFL